MLVVAIIFFSCLILTSGTRVPIPACPDLGSLPSDIEKLNSDQLSNLKCFCSGGDDDNLGINVNCIFGSKLEDLVEALNAIDDVNGTVFKISLAHVEVGDGDDALTLEEALSSASLTDLRELEIRNCRSGALVEHRENPLVEFPEFSKLESVYIDNCDLDSMPSLLISKSTALRALSLTGNKITEIKKDNLMPVADTLERLDLTSNLITKTEAHSLSQLKALKELSIGEHNYADGSFLEQLGQVVRLEKLNMTRMDGVDDLSKVKFMASGNKKIGLRQWILTGCNLKALNDSDFDGLSNLEELDLRVNLLEAIETGAFVPLTRLKKLSLAGNFLNQTQLGADLWKGLENLDTLDLGWNEIASLPSGAFKGLSALNSLSLRHNEKLSQIEAHAFSGLNQLRFLNLSGTALTKIEPLILADLVTLEEIHLSYCNISVIEPGAFEVQKSTLRNLTLNGNNLRFLDVEAIKGLYNIQEINLSQNPWLCDQNVKPVIDWVRSMYMSAAEASRPFFLVDSADTTCARPYTKSGVGLLELSEADLGAVYNETLDTTTPSISETTTIIQNDFENITAINFEDLFHVIGVEGNDTLDAIEDAKKPQYDINRIKFGQKTTSKNPTNSLFATIAVTALVIITAVSIVLMVRHRRSREAIGTSASNESQKRPPKPPIDIEEKSSNGATTAV